MRWIDDVRAELAELDASPRALRRFGLVVGAALAAVAGWAALRDAGAAAGASAAAAALLAATGLVAPRALRGVHRRWMAVGLAMGWVSARVALAATFFLVLTPIGLARRLVARRPPAAPASYWTPRPPRRGDYERMW